MIHHDTAWRDTKDNRVLRRGHVGPMLASAALALLLAACGGGNTSTDQSSPGSNPPPADTTPPSTPANLAATAVSASQINLSWSASSDNVGVSNYRIERCPGVSCTGFTQIATTSATNYSSTGLSASTTYRYRVRAADAAGNPSAYSAIVSATTLAGGGGGNLASLAASLSPGQWATLSENGDGTGYNQSLLISCIPNTSDCADNILNYADKGMWNPNTREIHYIGKGHMREARHIVYTESTHRWSVEPLPAWAGGDYGIGHGFEHSAIDATTGNIYLRLFNSTSIYRWSRTTKEWTPLPSGPNTAVVAAIEYFPEMGGLVYVGGGEVYFYSESQGRWSHLATGLTMGPYSNVATYSPVHRIVVLGGGNGSNALYRLRTDGTLSPVPTTVQGSPLPNIGVQSSVFTVDPVSGKYLLFGSGGGFYEYDVDQNRWNALSGASVPFWATNAYNNRILYRVAVPISTHGVIAFMGYNPERVWLYKHAGY